MAPEQISDSFAALLFRDGPADPAMPLIDQAGTSDGTVSVSPARAVAGEWGTWTVRFTVGPQPIAELGGIRVQLPEAWHAGIRNSAFRVQATAAGDPNFVRARSSNDGVRVETLVENESDAVLDKGGRLSNLNMRGGYYDYVTRVIIHGGSLAVGDIIELVYGDTRAGSRGFRAGLVAFDDEPVLVAVDHAGLGRFRLHSDRPTLAVDASEPTELLITAPSDAVVGERFLLKIALVDAYANPATGFGGTVTLGTAEGGLEFSESVIVVRGTGWAEAWCEARVAGYARMRAEEASHLLAATSNPICVHEKGPAGRVFWGDIHSHTVASGDGVGSGPAAYSYARHVAGLDFYSRTDHSDYFEDGEPFGDFGAYVALADEMDEPGSFATIHGYEVSFGSPWGHHNVYFRGRPGPVVKRISSTLPELWKALAGCEALTIPHHTLKMPAVVDWGVYDNPKMRRNFEIYSAHGLSEEFDPYHPLAIEQSLFTNPSTTSRRGTSAQQAWERGMVLSTIASSDDHRAHPGMPHQGVTAVFAGTLSREAIFDGLQARRTYATTGPHILLDFHAAGCAMGEEGTAEGPVEIACSAAGTDYIELAEVLRHTAGRPGFEVIASLRPRSDRFEWRFGDVREPGPAIYYARLRQRGLVRGTPAMAWSSPIWITVNG